MHDIDRFTAAETLSLQFGPLGYRFTAHDAWGQQVLAKIADHLAAPKGLGQVSRKFHLLRCNAAKPADLIDALEEVDFEDRHRGHWQKQNSLLGSFWQQNPCNGTVLWTAAATCEDFSLRFELPWRLLIDDLVERGGGVVHAGLAHHIGSGLLFLAPPSGGKSTTLSTASPDWQVLSDDAAMLWPDPQRGWMASPLPAWGDMIRPAEPWRYPGIDCGRCCRLNGLVFLEKNTVIGLDGLSAAAAVPALYRALCEYPAAILTEVNQRAALFRTAAKLSRQLACWQLKLPLHGDVWPLLQREAA